MNALITFVMVWISSNFSLESVEEHPHIEFLTAEQINAMYHRPFASPLSKSKSSGRETLAVYDNRKKTIYLNKNWDAENPADQSILVHEMVHHLQNIGKMSYNCPEEREMLAYKAQDHWLQLFGRSLETEFKIDSLTRHITTRCLY